MAPKEKKDTLNDLYLLKRKLQREKREIRKKALGIDEDHRDSSLQRIYTEGTKTRRALKVEFFGSKSKSSAIKGGDETAIEVFVRQVLVESEIVFIEQKAIRYINCDFYIPSHNLAIQVNGTYWHCDARHYPDGPKNKTQRKNVKKDEQAREIIEGEGISLLIIWEHDIKKTPEEVKSKLLKRLKEP